MPKNVIISCIIFAVISSVAGELAIVRQQDNSSRTQNFMCISDNRVSALAWILPTDPTTISVDEKFGWKSKDFPFDDTRDFDRYRYEKYPLEYIFRHSSRSTRVVSNENENYDFGPVLDYRWNDFRTYHSPNKSDSFGSIPISLMSNQTTRIYISVLAKENASILLSQDQVPVGKPLYWILLDGWRPKIKSAIFKCSNGIENDTCTALKAEQMGQILRDGKHWVHLSIVFSHQNSTKNNLKITVIVHDNKKTSFSFEDFDEPYNANFIHFNGSGYWKVHKYDVYKFNPADRQSYSIYILLFKLHPRLRRSNCLVLPYHSQYLATMKVQGSSQTIELQAGKEWQFARISNNYYDDTIEITFNTTSNLYLSRIIFKPGNCMDNDIYISKLQTDKKYTCEELKTETTMQFHEKPVAVCYNKDNYKSIVCNIECKSLFNDSNCFNVKVCGEKLCSCFPGYGGTRCNKVVQKINVFSDTKVISNEVEIQLSNETISAFLKENVQKIVIFYKEVNDIGLWKNEIIFWPVSVLYVRGLKRLTNYDIRVTLIINDGSFLSDVAAKKISTKCAAIEGDKIKITTNSSDIQVNWKHDNKYCPLFEYKLRVEDKSYDIESLPFTVEKTVSNQKYEIEVYHKNTIVTSYDEKSKKTTDENLTLTTTTGQDVTLYITIIGILAITLLGTISISVYCWFRNIKTTADKNSFNFQNPTFDPTAVNNDDPLYMDVGEPSVHATGEARDTTNKVPLQGTSSDDLYDDISNVRRPIPSIPKY